MPVSVMIQFKYGLSGKLSFGTPEHIIHLINLDNPYKNYSIDEKYSL
jgi:hypothetical protein